MTSKHNGTNGNMPEYAAKKPIAITQDGKFILAAQMGDKLSLGVGSLHSLEMPLQQKLTLERIRLDPKYELGIFSLGRFKKAEVIDNVEALTDLGRMVIEAEINYCNEFASLGLRAEKEKAPPTIKPVEVIMPPLIAPYKKVPFYVKNTALFCENTTDSVTVLAKQYRKDHVHAAFLSRGFKVVVLEGVDANRTRFIEEATRLFVVFIGGIGHGSPTVYTGNLGNHILEVGMYDTAEVKNKVIHLLSCQTAKQLGPNIRTKGAYAYGGYFENFTFVYDNTNTTVNEMDLFWKCDSTFDISMANGFTVEQAHNLTIAAYNTAMAQVPNTSAATWLLWDRNYFRSPVINTIYGVKSTSIQPFTKVFISIPLDVTQLELNEEELVHA